MITAIASLFGFHSHSVQPLVSVHAVRAPIETNKPASTSPITSQQSTATAKQESSPVVTFPTGTDVLYRGRTYNITWQNEASTTGYYLINLEVASNGSYYVMASLGTVSAEQQSVAFTVPESIAPRTNYQINISNAPQIADVVARSQAFTIK